MDEFVRLQICEELGDTQAWVAPGLERQQIATASAPEAAKDASVVDDGSLAVPAPVQAPQPPPTTRPARSMPQRMSRFTVWAAGGITQLLDSARATCVR
ncbi:hypothetical protein Tco_0395695, partial [Tanacetum coccineum]